MSMDMISLSKFKQRFEEQRNDLLQSFGAATEELQVSSDDLADEADLCSSELASSMKMRLRNREVLFLKKIGEALQRIEDGTFGDCESCGEAIDLKRLEARPTASHCIACKEEQERREHVHVDGRRFKSLGSRLRLA